MTGRAVFGDFVQATHEHLKTLAHHPADAGRPNPATVAAEIQEYTHGLHHVLKVMTRYTADIAESARQANGQDPATADPWTRALAQARRALQDAYLHSPLLAIDNRTKPQVRRTGTVSRQLAAAATAMNVGRDLLQTHFATSPDNTRRPRSEWSAIIASVPAGHAMLADLAGFARQIVENSQHLTTARTMHQAEAVSAQRRLTSMRQGLSVLVSVVETAQGEAPIPERDIEQLHAIPVNVLQPRRQPSTESIAGLCQGTIDTSERVRRVFAAAVPETAWSPHIIADSFRQTAASAVAISHHCEVIQLALADRASFHGAPWLSRKLLASARTAARAGQAWLHAARALYPFQTDATSDSSPAAAETADLMLWTGCLAHADPEWTPSPGTARITRTPAALAPGPVDLMWVAAAVHQATTSLTAIAAADYTRIRAAAQAGRILTPTRDASEPGQDGHLFTRAPRDLIANLLRAYRDAGTASVKATARTAEIAADAQGYSRRVMKALQADPRAVSRQVAVGRVRRVLDPASPAAIASTRGGKEMPGPVERILLELGVTDPVLVHRGMVIDKAASQLLDEAAQETAAQRWNGAVTGHARPSDMSKIIDHVLVRGNLRPAISAADVTGRREQRPRTELESPQVEP